MEAGSDAAAAALTAALGAAGVVEGTDTNTGLAIASGDGTGALALNDINEGTVLYIDPNDPQAAALLQQAGLMLSEDGTVQSIGSAEVNNLDAGSATGVPQELLLPNATEGELVETNTTDDNASKPESVNLPSAPDPTVRQKDIIEESLVRYSWYIIRYGPTIIRYCFRVSFRAYIGVIILSGTISVFNRRPRFRGITI